MFANTTGCYCRACNTWRKEEITGLPLNATRMIVCPECGNKRCPKASHHVYGMYWQQ